MSIELKQHFVAFLDILGFSEMVSQDVVSRDQENLQKLFRCHNNTSAIFGDDPSCTVTQFSDSVVVAKPFDSNGFDWFAERVARYQRALLDEGLLCRGGIAVNKHFSNASFTFSAGLIDAYYVESRLARYPRVVVSPDVVDLVFPDIDEYPESLIHEDDGFLFLNYIGRFRDDNPAHMKESIQKLVVQLTQSSEASLREKALWLANYSDAVLGTSLAPPRFSTGR